MKAPSKTIHSRTSPFRSHARCVLFSDQAACWAALRRFTCQDGLVDLITLKKGC